MNDAVAHTPADADSLAAELVARLTVAGETLVLAESCTCGMVAALIGGIPGASNCFAGSAVTYQVPVKTAWLDVSDSLIRQHTAESPQTTAAMARGALARTPGATIAAAITGHLGPGAPAGVDGIVHMAFARPDTPTWSASGTLVTADRRERQRESAAMLLQILIDQSASPPSDNSDSHRIRSSG